MIFPANSPFYEYVLKNGYRSHPILQQLHETTMKHPLCTMAAVPDEVAFIQFLIGLIGAKKVLEIGVFTGFTTLGMALALPHDGKVVGLDISQEYADIGRPFWKQANVDHKIDLKIGLALESLNQIIANNECDSFDFIFLDADKSNYPDYYEKSLQLVKKGGIIAIDNTLWRGKVADSSANDDFTIGVRRLNDIIKQDDRIDFVMLTVCDGVTLVRKK